MVYKGLTVTINNYKEIFKDLPVDSLDVIRSAVLDGIPMGKYIDMYGNNPYMLWQVKLGIDETLDIDWFSLVKTGENLKLIREINKIGVNLKDLKKYVTDGVSSECLKKIILWYSKGISLKKYNFSILPENLLDVFNFGMCLGLDMSVFNNGISYKKDYILACIKIMQNGHDVKKYLTNKWDLACVMLLSDYSKRKYFKNFDAYIHEGITPSLIEELYECCKAGLDISDLALTYTDGTYTFSSVQARVVREAFKRGYDYKQLMDYSKDIGDILVLFSEMELKSKKKISGVLNKN